MNVHSQPVPLETSATETAIRVDLAACYRLVALYGWDDLIFTHISARVPGPEFFLTSSCTICHQPPLAAPFPTIDVAG